MRVALAAVVLLSTISCAIRRIEKQPVPTRDQVRATALAHEGDQLLLEGKDHLALLKYLEASRLNAYHEVIFNKLAIAYSRLQQFQQAQEAVERAIGLNPDYPFARNTQGIIHLAFSRYGKAVRSLRHAVELRPEEANFWVNLGHAHIRQDNFQRGVEAYRKALAVDPDIFSRGRAIEVEYASAEGADPDRLYRVARIFAQLGDESTCLYYLGKALSAGFRDGEQLRNDPAFQPLRHNEDFISLMQAFGFPSAGPVNNPR